MKFKSYISILAGVLLSLNTFAQQDPAVSSVEMTPYPAVVGQATTITVTVGNNGSAAITGSDELNRMGFAVSLGSGISGAAVQSSSTALSHFDITYDAVNNVVNGIQKDGISIDPSTNYTVIITGTIVPGVAYAVANITPDAQSVINGAPYTNDAKVAEAALPVTLANFTVTNENQSASLEWQTTEEVNSDRFEVMRSSDSKNWTIIGSRDAHRNSIGLQTYNFMDASPENGTNYYRLKMIDLDGSYAMSSIRSIVVEGRATITISPNPASHYASINVPDETQVQKIEVRNTAGQTVMSSSKVQVLDVKHLPTGMYIIAITKKDGQISTHKLLKQ